MSSVRSASEDALLLVESLDCCLDMDALEDGRYIFGRLLTFGDGETGDGGALDGARTKTGLELEEETIDSLLSIDDDDDDEVFQHGTSEAGRERR